MATLGADELVCENQGGEVIWSFSFLLSLKKKKSWRGEREGRSGEGIYLFSCDGDGTPSLPLWVMQSGQLQPALLVTLTLTSCDYPLRLRGNSGSILARVLGGPLQGAGAW